MTREEMYRDPLYRAISARLGEAAQELRVMQAAIDSIERMRNA